MNEFMQAEELICLDVGTKRIGVARANTLARIPEALFTIEVDGSEIQAITDLAAELGTSKIVVGLPRNQSGEETQQSQFVRDFAEKLSDNFEIIWQDESLTSLVAETELKAKGKKFSKGEVDAIAARQILQDYLESL